MHYFCFELETFHILTEGTAKLVKPLSLFVGMFFCSEPKDYSHIHIGKAKACDVQVGSENKHTRILSPLRHSDIV